MTDFNDHDLFQDAPRPANAPKMPTLPSGSTPWLLGGLCLLATIPSLISGLPAQMAERDRVKADLDKVSQLQVDAVSQESLAKVAEARYTNGCRFVVAKLDPSQAAALGEGINVIDRATNNYLPSGTVVCDFVGSTAVLKSMDLDGDGVPNPAATDFAFTGNAAVVQQAMQTAGFDAQINNPRN